MIKNEKSKQGKDKTSSPRQEKYLERLEAAKGKRLVVDLSADGNAALEGLLSYRYGGTTLKAVVNKALADAFAREKKKKEA